MTRQIRILLQTTIPTTEDDWSIARFSRLGALLAEQRDAEGQPVFAVTRRDRDPLGAPDSVLSTLDRTDFDEMWLFAVDVGDGLTPEDCAAISRFRASGRGLLVARDPMDLGSSVCTLGGVGKAHYFHSQSLGPDLAMRERDEGAVGAPENEGARIVAGGVSKITGRRFNIAVAFEPGPTGGPAIAQSTFHHFVDYNWDTRSACPSFVDEPPGDAILRHPQAIADTRRYAVNVARWLAQAPNHKV